jgi:ribosomal protein S4E
LINQSSVLVQGILDTQLETVVSKKAGSPVVVLRGAHTGRTGRLLEKRRDGALLELTESRDVAEVSLDDVADFEGHLEGEDF